MNQHEFVIEYGEYIYKAAYKCYWKLKGKPSSDREDDLVCDIAVKIIETFSTKISDGSFRFKGDSNIKTYIYGAVFNSMREELFGKQYYPKYVTKYGEAGILLYNLRYLNNYSRKEAIELTLQELNISRAELDRIDKDISKTMRSSIILPAKSSSREVGSSELEDYLTSALFSSKETPENSFFMGELRTRIISILKELKPIHNDLIRMKLIEDLEVSKIVQLTGLKDNQGVYNNLHAAKKAFIKEAERQNFSGWVDFNLKGLNHG